LLRNVLIDRRPGGLLVGGDRDVLDRIRV